MSKTKVTVKKPDYSNIKRAIEQLATYAGQRVEAIASETAPVDSGNYRLQIKFNGRDAVIAQAKYSAAIEYGTAAHEIRPVTKKALHFEANGKEVFAKRVWHKGTQPNPVMRNAAAQTQKEINKIWQKALRENNV